MPIFFFFFCPIDANLFFFHSLGTGEGGKQYRAGCCTRAPDKVNISFMCQIKILLRVKNSCFSRWA